MSLDDVQRLRNVSYALDQAAIVARTDARGRIDYVNDNFCAISGYARDELLGSDHRIVNSGHHPKTFMRNLWHTIAGGDVWRGEIRNRRKDGTLYWVDTTIVPLLDGDDEIAHYLSIRYDVTDRKLAETRLREQEALAHLGRMAAVVAHEVKNPLAAIAGAAQVLALDLPENAPGRDAVRDMLDRIGDLDGKVRDLLEFARPAEPRFAEIDLGELVQERIALLRHDPAARGVRWDVSVEPARVEADASALSSALTNVLLNAAQAIEGADTLAVEPPAPDEPRGTIAVTVTHEGDDTVVRIHDDGCGIPDDARARVFEPFYTTKARGTGLGLSIARRTVQAHGGKISIADGAPGTIVSLRLPRSSAPPGTPANG